MDAWEVRYIQAIYLAKKRLHLNKVAASKLLIIDCQLNKFQSGKLFPQIMDPVFNFQKLFI